MTQSIIPPKPGDVIRQKYRIERVLGQGGMGLVFEASHMVTAKRFAIKWLLSDRGNSDGAVARFVREAQVAGRCEHRNIVEVYDIDREGEAMFMVMELLKGESLAERLARGGALGASDACRLLVPCLEAVSEAHAAGIIHRDLKPANIFICQPRGREPEMAKVLDFGVSRFASTQEAPMSVKTKDGTVIGTPFYMSPEQMRSQPIDLRADVYSMGITFYEVLSGVRPYNAHSYGDLLLKVADANPIPLGDLVAGLPNGLVQIVDKAMAFDRTERFADMREFASALEPYLRPHAAGGRTVVGGSSSAPGTLSIDTPWVSESNSFDLEDAAAKPRVLWPWIGAVGLAFACIVGAVAWDSQRAPGGSEEQSLPRPRDPRDTLGPVGSQAPRVPSTTTNAATDSPSTVHGSAHGSMRGSATDGHAVRPDAGSAEPEPVAVPVDAVEPAQPTPAAVPTWRMRRGGRGSHARGDEQPPDESDSRRDTSSEADTAASHKTPARNRVKNRAHATMERSEF